MSNTYVNLYFLKNLDTKKNIEKVNFFSRRMIELIDENKSFHLNYYDDCRESIVDILDNWLNKLHYFYTCKYTRYEFTVSHTIYKDISDTENYINYLKTLLKRTNLKGKFYVENNFINFRFEPSSFSIPSMSLILYFMKYAYIFEGMKEFNHETVIERMIKTDQYNYDTNLWTAFGVYHLAGRMMHIWESDCNGISTYLKKQSYHNFWIIADMKKFNEIYGVKLTIGGNGLGSYEYHKNMYDQLTPIKICFIDTWEDYEEAVELLNKKRSKNNEW